jgi:hypothetical protein
MVCVRLELRQTEIDALIRRKRLASGDHANIVAIRKAVHGFLDDYLE